jgi:hypothetical protein
MAHVTDAVCPNGRFAELEDPEGNRVRLWEPNAASIARHPEYDRHARGHL